MTPLYIAGAGGLGRELLEWLRDSPDFNSKWAVAGYLDDAPAGSLKNLRLPHLGSIDTAPVQEGALVALAIARPTLKLSIAQRLKARGLCLFSYIHPGAKAGPGVTVGEGSLILPGSRLTCDIVIGERVLINLNVTLGHDVTIGDDSTIYSGSNLAGGVSLGKGVTVGTSATLIPNRRVGDGSVVGAGAVVISHIKAGITVFGNPAKPI